MKIKERVIFWIIYDYCCSREVVVLYDIIIIGGGMGGYVAAIRGAQLGAKVVLIEKDKLGGVCLNRGCIPTKTLLHSAELFTTIKKAERFGILVASPELDFNQMMARKDQVVKTHVGGVQWLMKSNGIDVIHGNAELVSPEAVSVNGKQIEARNLIIAVGSVPAELSIPGAGESNVITSDEVFSLDHLPESIVIIGGGVIGVEMAALFQNLDCITTVIELLDRIVPMMDGEVSASLTEILKRQGVRIITGARVEAIQREGLSYNRNEVSQNINASLVLMAVGRRSNGNRLDFDKLGIKHDRGFIATDERLRTNIPGVYAVGDVNGKYMLAHVAAMEGIVAVENIMGHDRVMDYHAVPQCIYTFPEVASVGLTEEEAVNEGYRIKVSRFPVKANGKSMADGNWEGFIKMVAGSTGEILGVHIIGPHATEMITQGSMAIGLKATAADITRIVFPHPTVSEIISEAAHGIVDRPIHI
jgi:dihydrolipoamide dehydrogenase